MLNSYPPKPLHRLIGAAALYCLGALAWPQSLTADQTANAALPAVINEASGLTASLRHPDIYWTHNDNTDLPASSRKSQPLVFAIDESGQLRATLTLAGVNQRDWEAITEANISGIPTLIIGDIGDNRGTWPDYRLWFIPEPTLLTPKATVPPSGLLRFRYPDQIQKNPHQTDQQTHHQGSWSGGHDAEAMVFDPRAQELLILTKREKPARLFAVPLSARISLKNAATDSFSQQIRQAPVITAHFITNLPPLPAPDFISWLLHPFVSPYADQPTDMALSPSGDQLAVLTYSALFFFQRAPGERWQAALAKPVRSVALPFIDQWEGLSYSPDGKKLLIVREGTGADTLLHLPVPGVTE